MISITDQRVLFEKIIEAVTTVTEANLGWLTLKDEKTSAFVLVSQLNLPDAWAKKIGQPLDDGVSSLVAMSAMRPYKCTGMIALVRGVIAASSSSGSII